jgi:hypothetical protein
VVKAVNAATNNASTKWTHLFFDNTVTVWNGVQTDPENMTANDWTVVHSFIGDDARLISVAGNYKARFGTLGGFVGPDNSDVRVVYGIAPAAASDIRMPFNRADFYMRVPATLPSRCAAGTGILYKATVNHGDDPTTTPVEVAGQLTELPLHDCVADMQVVYEGDFNDDGISDVTDDISPMTAAEVRRTTQVRVYILAQEGQRDSTFTFNTNPFYVGDAGMGRPFNFATAGIANWQNYRWKLLTIIVSPRNLR